MKVSRSGRYRHKGTTQLIDKDLSTVKATKHIKPWNTAEASIKCSATGEQGSASYIYRIELTSDEIFRFLELGVEACASNICESAMGMSAIASLRELLRSQNGE